MNRIVTLPTEVTADFVLPVPPVMEVQPSLFGFAQRTPIWPLVVVLAWFSRLEPRRFDGV
jgi:hypothetical protein